MNTTNSDYQNKYIKYKKKYLQIKNNKSGGSGEKHPMILVDGTSSSGKTTICEYFTKLNYKCFQIDNYWNDPRINFVELFKNIPNKYGEADKIYETIPVKFMVEDALESRQNFLLDHIDQKEIINLFKEKNIDDKLFIINVFTNLTDMARNLESRRKSGDRRGVFAFNQFAKRYIETNQDDESRIEKVNRKKFIQVLRCNFKYEFANKDKLVEFANDLFSNMNITDDLDHWIKLRPEIRCDYLLVTTSKNKNQIFDELESVII
jgi:hypothetical protein